jgi:UrcA family protein
MFTFHRFTLGTLLLCAGSVSLQASPVQSSASTDALPSKVVSYRDLNLDSKEGVAVLFSRIRDAALDVCRSAQEPQTLSRTRWPDENTCVSHAIAQAVHAVGSDKLSAYHWARVRGPRAAGTKTPLRLARK